MKKWQMISPPFADFKKEVFLKAAKTGEFIYQIGEYPQLREPSREVKLDYILKPETQQKIEYLRNCLLRYRELTGYGRGISAVQVGIPERFFIIYTPEKFLTIINPKITDRSPKLYKYPEMCMSVSPIIAPTVRPAWIEFEYYDENATKQTWSKKDDTEAGRMMNRVFQHENDHLQGIINIDLVGSPKELFLLSDPSYYDSAAFEEV